MNQAACVQNNRIFRVGQSICWNPPLGVYGPKSLQSNLAGQNGVVTALWNDSYLLADIGGQGGVLLSLDYVEAAQ
ncbi:MAG TPA: hypothetical protein P5149_10395 [Candidatus Competibacteraceae bacterium]|nr:hypothetical protein [Candidatus Competibacteraceae bacterium]HPF60034.1 hypothetical protein [Candidatus Competibacteraceae bacterium]HRY18801.1 hypothetical protein [Candidatus Competibacteraceae bacterium]